MKATSIAPMAQEQTGSGPTTERMENVGRSVESFDDINIAKMQIEQAIHGLSDRDARFALTYVLETVEIRSAARLRALSTCESPIERMLLEALLSCGFELSWPSVGTRIARNMIGDAWLHQQEVVLARGYRLDFSVHTPTARIAIECDGHDYHERTKEQAKHDRSRDRALTLAGWTVLRFTGSEIYADAIACASQVIVAAKCDTAKGPPKSQPPKRQTRARYTPQVVETVDASTSARVWSPVLPSPPATLLTREQVRQRIQSIISSKKPAF